MGYTEHHAIIVTSWKEASIRLAHALATELMASQVTPILQAPCNGFYSFAVLPDGSKEGWTDSELGDERREKLKVLLRMPEYDDGSSSVEWVEVVYGHDVEHWENADGVRVVDSGTEAPDEDDTTPPQGTGTGEGSQ